MHSEISERGVYFPAGDVRRAGAFGGPGDSDFAAGGQVPYPGRGKSEQGAMLMAASFLLDGRHDRPPAARFFCVDCGRPWKMLDDDLDEIFAKSNYCRCPRGRS